MVVGFLRGVTAEVGSEQEGGTQMGRTWDGGPQRARGLNRGRGMGMERRDQVRVISEAEPWDRVTEECVGGDRQEERL